MLIIYPNLNRVAVAAPEFFLMGESLPSLRSWAPWIQLGGLGRCKLSQWGLGQSPRRNRFFVHFSLKIWRVYFSS